jgi:mRNA-degrading endonuclease RelE of RelBE toxin-antitoxin system
MEVVIKEELQPDLCGALRRSPVEGHEEGAHRLAPGERGDIRSLDQSLTGYYRLRVGKYRIIFRYQDNMTIEVVFIEERRLVYEVYEEQLARKLIT